MSKKIIPFLFAVEVSLLAFGSFPWSYGAEQIPPTTIVTEVRTSADLRPQISAASYIIVDTLTGQILSQYAAHESLAPASLTKIMTALVAVENLDLEQETIVSSTAANMEPSKIYLLPNEKIKVKDLLQGMLISSANDAAVALAEAAAGSQDEFTNLMNQKAAKLNLQNSFFKNPSGVDQPGHMSSSYDMAILSLELIKNPFLSEAINTRLATIYSTDNQISHLLRNTNQALSLEGVIGVKTGSTDEAGQTLSLLVNKNGRQFLAVFLGSRDRTQDASTIVDWIYSQNTWRQLTLPYCSFSWKYFLLTTVIQEKECYAKSFDLVYPLL